MTQPNPSAPEQPSQPTVVGIGASAGGLAALKTFFAHVPADSGLAFVVVVHLSPEHKSHLADLLQPYIKMPIRQVTETTPLEANHVYIIPPNANLDTVDTHLRLSELEANRRERAPIDHFFRTLATTHDGHAIGVILSGTGSDGTLGMKEIKAKGGLTIVQDPNEAEYDGMPQSAIATGLIDLILPLIEMPPAILRFTQTTPRVAVPEDEQDLDNTERRLLQKIFAQIQTHTGRDFSRYKRSTIMRRITRRMQLAYIEELERYLDLMQEQPEEIKALADDLLITVTSFFRDPEVFQKLEADVIPQLFTKKGADDEIRAWSVGCATGEEAYSLAMLLLEAAARQEISPRLQIFASDLHEHSLDRAREGFYPGDIEADVSAERLRRFFTQENGGYRIRKEVRELVVFAPHNLLGDPPFSRLDLIACRNVLIYLRRDIQNDVVDLFHYALRPEGYLVLGTSETLEAADLFRTEDKKRCIFQKRNVPGPEPRLSVFPLTRARLSNEAKPGKRADETAAFGAFHQQLVERYAPPSLLVSPDDNVVHLSEHAGRYLVHPGGQPTTNVFKLVREELRIELRTALYAARGKKQAVSSRPTSVRFNGETGRVMLHVRAALEPNQAGFVLVIFDEREAVDPAGAAPDQANPADVQRQSRINELETELNLTRQRLQAIIEQYETGQEEMRAANEEMQSTNEELRSTMEELETSKEELQSMNEELQTVNQENRHKVEELAQLSGDLQNLLTATDIATLFLDRELRILRFTPKVGDLFNVRTTDRSRPLTDLTHRLGYDKLMADAEQVLKQLIPIEREIPTASGQWYLTRMMPYRSAEDRITGIVITFVDITDRKHAEEAVQEAREYAERIIDTLHEPLLVLTPDLRVRSANPAFYNQFAVRPEETEGRPIYDLGNNQWDIPALRTLLEDVLPENNVFNDFEVEHDFEQIGRRVMRLNARRLENNQLILLGIHDITERKQSEMALRQSEERLQQMMNIEGVGVLTFDESGVLISANDTFLRLHGYSRQEIEAGTLTWRDLTPAEYVEESERQLQKYAETGRIGPYEKEYLHKDGSRAWMLFAGARLNDGTIIEYCIDVSERKQAEEALQQSEARLEAEVAAMRQLHELVARLLVSTDLQTALEEVLEAAITLTGAEMGNIQLFNPATNTLEFITQQGFASDFLDHFGAITNDAQSATGRALAAGRRVVVEDVQSDPGYAPYREAVASAGYRAVQSTPLTSRDGDLLGMLSTHYPIPHHPSERDLRLLDIYARQAADFIEHVRSEEALRQSEQRFREIFEAAGVSVWVEDFSQVKQALDERRAQGVEDWRAYFTEQPAFVRQAVELVKIVDVNTETIDLFEASTKADLLGSLVNIFTPATEALFMEELVTLAEGRESLTAEASLQTLTGRPMTMLCTIHFGPPSGHYNHVVVTLTDITVRKQAEDLLQRANEQLEQRVAERTLELAEQNQRLRLLAIQLTEAEQQERRRIAKVLHDGLQQLLIAGKMQLPFYDTDQGSEVVEQLAAIFDEADEIARTLSYELSPPTLYSSNLPDALRWLADWFYSHHRFKVDVRFEPAFPILPDQLKVFLYEAVRELLLNAVKHSGAAMATVTLQQPQANQIAVTVADEGQGCDPDHLEPNGEELHGFGLFSIRERLIALGGSLRIDSAPNEGAQFVITIPLVAVSSPNGPSAAATSISEPAARADRPQRPVDRPIRVLLVDDHSLIRTELTTLLEREADIEVIGQAADGREAIDQATALQPDVIVMDIEMPELNGIEATRRIKVAFPAMVIIGLSISEEPGQTKMLQAGASNYLRKDGGVELLVQTIRDGVKVGPR